MFANVSLGIIRDIVIVSYLRLDVFLIYDLLSKKHEDELSQEDSVDMKP
jgi:hypothetical protein